MTLGIIFADKIGKQNGMCVRVRQSVAWVVSNPATPPRALSHISPYRAFLRFGAPGPYTRLAGAHGWHARPIRWRRPTLYHTWLLNMIAANLTERVLPLVAPSLLASRVLEFRRIAADVIYLDSAHEMHETFLELVWWSAPRMPIGARAPAGHGHSSP